MPRRPLAALVALLLVTAGCSGPDAAELLDRAPEALEDAGTSRFEMDVSAAGEGVDSTYSASGEQDLAAGTLRMDTDLGLESTSTQTLVLGDEIYLRSPLFELFTGDPDLWVSVDTDSAGGAAGLDVDQLVEGNTGPAALVQQLRGAADDVEEVGTEEIRGVETTHLRVVVHTERAIEQSPEAMRDQLRSFAEASGLPDTYPMDVWIDDDALIRRVRTVVEVQDEAAGVVTQQTTLELFDFGVAVDIEAPDPDEVVEMSELLEDLAALEEDLDALDAEVEEPDAG